MTHSDIPFDTDDSHAFLPWVVGIMVCMATLLLCLGVTLGGWITDRHATYEGSFSVSVPATSDDATARLDKIAGLLKTVPGATGVTRVTDSALKDMLKPWLGTSDDLGDLPLPAMYDVATDGTTKIDYKDVQTRLGAIIPGSEVDAHERWIASFASFSTAMQALLTLLTILIVGGLALMIAFASRAALKLHARTVQLLHSIGAEDRYITRQFQRDAALLTLRGAVPGCFAAGLAYWGAGFYMTSLESSLIPSLAMHLSHLLLLVCMPLACGAVAWVTARFSVIEQLRHTL